MRRDAAVSRGQPRLSGWRVATRQGVAYYRLRRSSPRRGRHRSTLNWPGDIALPLALHVRDASPHRHSHRVRSIPENSLHRSRFGLRWLTTSPAVTSSGELRIVARRTGRDPPKGDLPTDQCSSIKICHTSARRTTFSHHLTRGNHRLAAARPIMVTRAPSTRRLPGFRVPLDTKNKTRNLNKKFPVHRGGGSETLSTALKTPLRTFPPCAFLHRRFQSPPKRSPSGTGFSVNFRGFVVPSFDP